MSNKNKINGISFMVRIRNEEKTLEKSLRSILENLVVPFEVVVILHLCTDGSEGIARKLQDEFGKEKVRILFYEYEISKCGYETLATSSKSTHSVVYYYNWCLQQLNCKWMFKWDGDFILTEALIAFLNEGSWLQENTTRYIINAKNTSHSNRETYLSDCLLHYRKFLFWEQSIYVMGSKIITLPDEVCIIHDSELNDCKPYWLRIPWYMTDCLEEAVEVRTKYNRLVYDFGEEPVGMARAANPECDEKFLAIHRAKPSYVVLIE